MIDGSVAVSWFLRDEDSAYGQEVRAQIPGFGFVTVPCHWMLEVVNALRMAERRKRIVAAEVNHAAGILRQLPIRTDLETHDLAGRQILELSRRHTLSIYDAAYLELALRVGARLASLDHALMTAAKQQGVKLA